MCVGEEKEDNTHKLPCQLVCTRTDNRHFSWPDMSNVSVRLQNIMHALCISMSVLLQCLPNDSQ